jgi:hypothetical protein
VKIRREGRFVQTTPRARARTQYVAIPRLRVVSRRDVARADARGRVDLQRADGGPAARSGVSRARLSRSLTSTLRTKATLAILLSQHYASS